MENKPGQKKISWVEPNIYVSSICLELKYDGDDDDDMIGAHKSEQSFTGHRTWT